MVLKLAEAELVGEILMAGAVQARLLGGLHLWHHFLLYLVLYYKKPVSLGHLDLYFHIPN
jgi:hypothetical protein